MGYTIEISDGSTTYTFACTPQLAINFENQYNETIPAQLYRVKETWVLTEVYLINDDPDLLINDYQTLISHLTDADTQISLVRLLRDGTEKLRIESSSTKSLRIPSITMESAEGAWNSYVKMNITIEMEDTSPSGGSSTNASEITYSYTYDENTRLATITKRGTITGSGATAAAKREALAFPSTGYWQRVTNGPDGIDIESVNESDTECTFVSTIKQLAEPVPQPQTLYSYTQSVSSSASAGSLGIVKTHSFTFSVGEEAEAVSILKDQISTIESSGQIVVSYDLQRNIQERSYSATISALQPEVDKDNTKLLKPKNEQYTVSFSIRIGGRRMVTPKISTINYADTPFLLFEGPIEPAEVTETITRTSTSPDIHTVHAPIWPDNWSQADTVYSPVTPVAFSATGKPMKYRQSTTRRYIFFSNAMRQDIRSGFEQFLQSMIADNVTYVTSILDTRID